MAGRASPAVWPVTPGGPALPDGSFRPSLNTVLQCRGNPGRVLYHDSARWSMGSWHEETLSSPIITVNRAPAGMCM